MERPGRAPVVRRLARRKGGPRLLRRRASSGYRCGIARRAAPAFLQRPTRSFVRGVLFMSSPRHRRVCSMASASMRGGDAMSARWTLAIVERPSNSHWFYYAGGSDAAVSVARSFTSSGCFTWRTATAHPVHVGWQLTYLPIDAPGEATPNAPVARCWTGPCARGTSWGAQVRRDAVECSPCTVDGDCPATSDIEPRAFSDCVPEWDQGAREGTRLCRKGWCSLWWMRGRTRTTWRRISRRCVDVEGGRFRPFIKRRLEEPTKRMTERPRPAESADVLRGARLISLTPRARAVRLGGTKMASWS